MSNIIYPDPKFLHYLNRYIKFIENINNVDDSAYVEKHHKLPKSMGGTNDPANIISLTPRQHFIAHWMLWKAYCSKEMTAAFFSMCNQNNAYQNRNYKITSRIYEQLKTEFSEKISESTKVLWKNDSYREKHQTTNQTEYTKNLRSKKAKELWQDQEYRKKLENARKAAWREGRVKRDHSKCGAKGEKNVAKRPDVKLKNSGENHYSKREGFIRPICEHCGMITTPVNILRWHNDKCKHKKN